MVSKIACCFIEKILRRFLNAWKAHGRPFYCRKPMSFGKAELMVGTFKSRIGRLLQQLELDWDGLVDVLVFSFCSRPLNGDMSPFELLYGVRPKLLPPNSKTFTLVCTKSLWHGELTTVLKQDAARAFSTCK